ncbi:MAG: hypothetical protein KAJ11_14345, partial [Alphaproteobacteria bacterium]|nr:hypothetical protein [Alphaproteobacteria bacterium]
DITSSLMAVGLIDAYLRSIIPQEARDHVTRPRPANQARTETARLDKALELLIKGRRIPAAEDGQ